MWWRELIDFLRWILKRPSRIVGLCALIAVVALAIIFAGPRVVEIMEARSFVLDLAEAIRMVIKGGRGP
jgi:hypothetical protein